MTICRGSAAQFFSSGYRTRYHTARNCVVFVLPYTLPYSKKLCSICSTVHVTIQISSIGARNCLVFVVHVTIHIFMGFRYWSKKLLVFVLHVADLVFSPHDVYAFVTDLTVDNIVIHVQKNLAFCLIFLTFSNCQLFCTHISIHVTVHISGTVKYLFCHTRFTY